MGLKLKLAKGTVLGMLLAGAKAETKGQLLNLLQAQDETGIHEGFKSLAVALATCRKVGSQRFLSKVG